MLRAAGTTVKMQACQIDRLKQKLVDTYICACLYVSLKWRRGERCRRARGSRRQLLPRTELAIERPPVSKCSGIDSSRMPSDAVRQMMIQVSKHRSIHSASRSTPTYRASCNHNERNVSVLLAKSDASSSMRWGSAGAWALHSLGTCATTTPDNTAQVKSRVTVDGPIIELAGRAYLALTASAVAAAALECAY